MFAFIHAAYENPYISRCLFHGVKQMKLKTQQIGCKTHHSDDLNKRNSAQLCKKMQIAEVLRLTKLILCNAHYLAIRNLY